MNVCRYCGTRTESIFCSKRCKRASRKAFDAQFKGMEITPEIGRPVIDRAKHPIRK